MIPVETEQIQQALVDASLGSNDAFEHIWDWCRQDLLRICRSKISIQDRRIGYEEDLYNEVMVCFWGELQKKQKMHNVNCDLVWRMMVRSATTLSIDRARFLSSKKRRSTGVKVELDDQVQGICPSDEFEVAEFYFQFVKDLPAADRELVKMCEAGKSCLEISSVFGVSPQVIYRKIRTIRSLWLTRSITAGWHRPIAQ